MYSRQPSVHLLPQYDIPFYDLTKLTRVPYYEDSMTQLSRSESQKKILAYTTLLAVVFGAWFLRGYFSMFVIAGTLAYLFYPLYTRLGRKMSQGSAATLTLLVSFLAILIPLGLTLLLAGMQLGRITTIIAPFFADLDTSNLLQNLITRLNTLLETLPFEATPITSQTITDGLKNIILTLGGGLLSSITGMFGSFIGAFSAFIIFLFVFLSLLKNGPSLLELFRDINPLGEELSELYLTRMGAMVRGTVQGQFAIAATQGFLGALAFAFAGFGDLFFVIFALFTLLSVIPLGAGILALPAGLLMILFGNVWGGVVVILEHLLINTNVDNILRPILVPKTAKLDPALMLVSVFAGIRLFGFLGIIIGPTLMIVIVTTIRAYAQYARTQHKSTKRAA